MSNVNNSAVLLTATQKGILAVVYNAQTPESAFENINGSSTLVTARNLLVKLGLITIGQNSVALTALGQDALVKNNIIDETGKITNEGTALVNAIAKTHGGTSGEFPLIKQLM